MATIGQAGTLTVMSVSPARHSLTNPLAVPIVVQFDRPVNPATVVSSHFWAFGRWSGAVGGTFSFANGNQTVILTPSRPFISGDLVTVFLSHDLAAADGSPMRSAGYVWQFYTRTRLAPLVFNTVDVISNRTNGAQTRIYGAAAADLNADGRLDLTTVNEVSSDIRVFLNTGNTAAPFTSFLTPHPISFEASPNDPSDFNLDGHADIAAAAAGTSTVWILMGQGDGTFVSPGQEIAVADAPHGIAILDFDGDGDTDIATSNTGGNNVSLLINNNGVFSAGTTFEGGGDGEYAIGAGDMNNDGITDLVVGAISSQRIIVHLGNGNGIFTQAGLRSALGTVWMLSLGDVNGDGNLDVSTANSFSNSGSILLGDGAGGLATAAVTPTGNHTVATDLGDLDGDGDLDWVLSSFSGGIWRVYENNGAGIFSFDQEFTAPANPSCAIILDFDNDRDLDLVLTDEIADIMVIERNGAVAPLGDFNGDSQVNATDFASMESCFGGPGAPIQQSCVHGDFDADGDVDCADGTAFQAAWTGPGSPPELSACAQVVPTVSQWGLAMLALAIGIAGTVVMRRNALARRLGGSLH